MSTQIRDREPAMTSTLDSLRLAPAASRTGDRRGLTRTLPVRAAGLLLALAGL